MKLPLAFCMAVPAFTLLQGNEVRTVVMAMEDGIATSSPTLLPQQKKILSQPRSLRLNPKDFRFVRIRCKYKRAEFNHDCACYRGKECCSQCCPGLCLGRGEWELLILILIYIYIIYVYMYIKKKKQGKKRKKKT